MNHTMWDACCQAGDYTVTKVPGGYMLGRTLPQQGRGPWWKMITLECDIRTAIARARELASLAGVHAWIQTAVDECEPIESGLDEAVTDRVPDQISG